MELRRVAVLGGGPGGLYAARLLKLARPGCEVVVHEQGLPDQTFGFGVGLAARTQARLAEADPATLDDILATAWSHDMRLRVGDREAGMDVSSLVAVGRADLLRVLARHAEDAGVKLEFGTRRAADELDADLVIAADGVGSATRAAGDFGEDVEIGTGWYLWAGVDVALPHALFAPERDEHGVYVTHAYPYAPDRSTFLVETDAATWRAAGFDRTTAALPPDASDDVALDHLSDVFARHLDGHRLIGNRTRWLRFRTVRCARWHDGRTVLLGDAAHTAHYSVGSGTKLAMEDAIALVAALDGADDPETALRAYEAARRPAVTRLQDIAERSRRWWESFPERLDAPVEQLLVAYMTRAGNVALDRFAAGTPAVVRGALAAWSDDPALADTVEHPETIPDEVLEQPLQAGGRTFTSRLVPDDPAALGAGVSVVDVGADARPAGRESDVEAALERALAAAADADVVWFTGADDRASVLTRLEVAERLRRRAPALVVVAAPTTCRGDVVDGLVSDRLHLAALRDPEGDT
ncbi:FAD-dependent monooxygenase [Actinomycetospora straminea]|uniref:FAD-binding domain-containing protein n=1 Tax=Actinomycetospora straminea TaxID=663607 RepID=A0ABP9FDF0_9PSEU|nr:FAD-dependent monooxygenase [Actinomycetospora straminea]MDD7936659.1 FAD-dependent monooxygenase [Actinomycetospora straminea]